MVVCCCCVNNNNLGMIMLDEDTSGVAPPEDRLRHAGRAGVGTPNLAIWSTDKGWVVENEGVPPDIEVEQTPADVIAGRDPQLERAIANEEYEIAARLRDKLRKRE